MEQKQRLFIYDRREVVVLVLLGVMVTAFSFTLGVHLGKRLQVRTLTSPTAEVKQIGTLQDSVPNRQELTEQGKVAQDAAATLMTQTLQNEVKKTGIKLNAPRQVDLPTQTASKNGGKTTLETLPAVVSDSSPQKLAGEHSDAAAHRGSYILQIGSFPSAEEAQSKMEDLRAQGLRPFVRPAHVPGLGRRFRLYVGSFPTQEAAEKAGRKYLSQRMIDSYLVSRFE